MHLTKHTDISLRVLMHLAAFPDELGTVKDISERYRVSRHHLVKVVHRLSGLGYLNTVQGRGGGISLALKPEEIQIGQVVRDMEASVEVIDCAGSNCPLTPGCLLKRALNRATDAFLDTLDEYSVADLVKNRGLIVRLVGS